MRFLSLLHLASQCAFGDGVCWLLVQPFSIFLLSLKQQNLLKIMFSCIHFPKWRYPPQNNDFFIFYTSIGWQVCNTSCGKNTKIRVSAESWPWRRTFSRRSCQDSNPRPFDHEAGALTTELSPGAPYICVGLWGALYNLCLSLNYPWQGFVVSFQMDQQHPCSPLRAALQWS